MRFAKRPAPDKQVMDQIGRMTTRLQAMTDRLVMQHEKTERACSGGRAQREAHSLSALRDFKPRVGV